MSTHCIISDSLPSFCQKLSKLVEILWSSDKNNLQYFETRCRLQHCLEWVMQVYTIKLTPDNVVTYLFHDCERSLWLFCLVWHVRTMIKVQYTATDSWEATSSAHVRNVWGISRVLLRISIWYSCHFGGFHVENRAVTRLLLLRRCVKSFILFL